MKAMLTSWLGASGRRAELKHSTRAMGPASAIDGEVLASLTQLQRQGQPDILQEVMRLFFKGAADLLQGLGEGRGSGDAALLYRASHALKSVSANVGAVALSSRCKDLEALAKSGTVPDAPRMVRAIGEDYRVVQAILSERLPQVA